MRILITGAAGFVGSHLANFLKAKGHYVRVVDIRPQAECYLPLHVDEVMQCDLRELSRAVEATEGMDWAFQLAANMGGIGYITEYNAAIQHDNALINLNMLDACRKNDIHRIFFSSSACIYNRLEQQVPENTGLKEERDDIPAFPDSAYGWEKLFSELVYQSYRHDYGLPIRIARFHNIYGPYCDYSNGREKAPAAICRKVAEASDGDTIEIWGDGKQTRSFTYIADCVEGIWRIMNCDYDKPLNLGTNYLVTIDQLATLVMSIAGKDLKIRHDLSKPQGVRGRNADLTLMKSVLKWEPQVSLRDGMTALYKWVKGRL